MPKDGPIILGNQDGPISQVGQKNGSCKLLLTNFMTLITVENIRFTDLVWTLFGFIRSE